jgi:hypothetical protein
MKSINKSLLVAAVLSSALAALAQTPGGQNPGSGGTSPDPSNETNTTNPSGARTSGTGGTSNSQTEGEVRGRAGSGTNTGSNSGMNTDSNTSGVDSSGRVHRGVDDMNQPKKRSFWDRLLGRNKQLDSNKHQSGTGSDDIDASGRRRETQP